ncbi:hypothetical protein PENSPDRAFT_645788 [Peniophora sp. CONT]|nr:hypothetical protein PENSPDRAFT_645788 [Peniophora sp. CONT]
MKLRRVAVPRAIGFSLLCKGARVYLERDLTHSSSAKFHLLILPHTLFEAIASPPNIPPSRTRCSQIARCSPLLPPFSLGADIVGPPQVPCVENPLRHGAILDAYLSACRYTAKEDLKHGCFCFSTPTAFHSCRAVMVLLARSHSELEMRDRERTAYAFWTNHYNSCGSV